MPTKIFTTIDGNCPFGKKIKIDSQSCRTCNYYYRAGTAMFFWCGHPVKPTKPEALEAAPEKKEDVPKKRKTGTRTKKRGQTPKKGKESRIKVIKQSKR